MIYDGFFDRYRKLTIIAAHGGGALPYLISRMDQCFDNIPACREKDLACARRNTCRRIYADAVVFAPDVLDAVRQGVRRRQRALRLRLSAHDRRHAGMPEARAMASPDAARDKVRGRNALRVFGL